MTQMRLPFCLISNDKEVNYQHIFEFCRQSQMTNPYQNVCEHTDKTIADYALEIDDEARLRESFSLGCDASRIDKRGNTILMRAYANDAVKCVLYLLTLRVTREQLGLRNKYGQTCLHIFVQHAADPSRYNAINYKNVLYMEDHNGITPFVLALGIGRFDMARHFVKKGYNVNMLNTRGKAPIHVIVGDYKLDTATANKAVIWLIKHGADPTLTDTSSRDAVEYAKQRNQLLIVKTLKSVLSGR